jgi:hypothetical protein
MNAAASSTPPPTPVSVVQRQLEAYNARDLDAFMAVMADDVVAVDAETGALIAEGAAALRLRYEQRFSTPVHCELLGGWGRGRYLYCLGRGVHWLFMCVFSLSRARSLALLSLFAEGVVPSLSLCVFRALPTWLSPQHSRRDRPADTQQAASSWARWW